MDPESPRGAGWLAFSAIVLIIGGFFALIDGLVAVNQARFFSQDAVFIFSDLNTWGWIIFGLGVLGIAAGLALFTGRQWARWTGIIVASLSAVGQLLFAQAYPLWSLMIMTVDFLVIYGLAVYGGSSAYAAVSGTSEETMTTSGSPTVGEMSDERRRAA